MEAEETAKGLKKEGRCLAEFSTRHPSPPKAGFLWPKPLKWGGGLNMFMPPEDAGKTSPLGKG
ncbi:MAG: hypothetical protein QXS80_09675 [Candidatus Caldarchaeum sp.]